MKIILMRHGNALRNGSDPARPLSEKGIREAKAAGKFLRASGENPDVILHSPLLRSLESAEHVEKELGAAGLLRRHYGIKPEDSPQIFLKSLAPEFEEYGGSDYTMMVVGHNPFISDLASLLLWRSLCELPFGTGTLLGAESYHPEAAWNLYFYVKTGCMSALFAHE